MKILVVGGGGREHALAWKLSQSPKVDHVFVAPGNAGIDSTQKCSRVAIADDDLQGLLDFAKKQAIDFTMVGPEKPLQLGIVDLFTKENLLILGAHQQAAQLESSKHFAKKIMQAAKVPTAAYQSFQNQKDLDAYLGESSYPLVMKYDGLAGGKGVRICENQSQALEYSKELFQDFIFGSDPKVVCEEFLEGRECSVILISDGKSYQLFESSQDHKRLLDQDQGPNTGGMGAYSPSPIFTKELSQQVCREIVEPLLDEFQKQKLSYRGILYIGLMITHDGPKVLEFNVRFGDPETQVLLPRIESDLLETFVAAAKGDLGQNQIQWSSKPCLGVVIAAHGYPTGVRKYDPIQGVDSIDHALVFHAGTQRKDQKLVTSGGRVLLVCALEDNIELCRDRVYDNIKHISFDGMNYRTDIGKDA
ncbi:MAG: phosphoribosylamine--glycine ligase [Bdellovibrionales bacterium]|nr:phosphoribosylamine--glycine ligase [Bdellovibrionales bacterium]